MAECFLLKTSLNVEFLIHSLQLIVPVLVVSNHWTGLWTGLLDWTDGLDYWT